MAGRLVKLRSQKVRKSTVKRSAVEGFVFKILLREKNLSAKLSSAKPKRSIVVIAFLPFAALGEIRATHRDAGRHGHRGSQFPDIERGGRSEVKRLKGLRSAIESRGKSRQRAYLADGQNAW